MAWSRSSAHGLARGKRRVDIRAGACGNRIGAWSLPPRRSCSCRDRIYAETAALASSVDFCRFAAFPTHSAVVIDDPAPRSLYNAPGSEEDLPMTLRRAWLRCARWIAAVAAAARRGRTAPAGRAGAAATGEAAAVLRGILQIARRHRKKAKAHSGRKRAPRQRRKRPAGCSTSSPPRKARCSNTPRTTRSGAASRRRSSSRSRRGHGQGHGDARPRSARPPPTPPQGRAARAQLERRARRPGPRRRQHQDRPRHLRHPDRHAARHNK